MDIKLRQFPKSDVKIKRRLLRQSEQKSQYKSADGTTTNTINANCYKTKQNKKCKIPGTVDSQEH